MKNLKELKFCHIKKEETTLYFEKSIKGYPATTRQENVKNTFLICEYREDKKHMPWSSICLHEWIVRLFPEINRIEIYYGEKDYKGFEYASVTLCLKDSVYLSFKQYYESYGYQSGDCSLIAIKEYK